MELRTAPLSIRGGFARGVTKRICGPPHRRDAEDGTTKGTLALLVALAAVVLFAPIARADVYDATHPYRNAVNPTPDGTAIGTADHDGDHNGNDSHDCDAHDEDDNGTHDGEAEDAAPMDVEALAAHASDDGGHDGDGCDDGDSSDTGSPPGDTTSPPQNPSTSGLLGGSGYWLWVLLVAIVAIAAGTGVVLRRRMTRNR